MGTKWEQFSFRMCLTYACTKNLNEIKGEYKMMKKSFAGIILVMVMLFSSVYSFAQTAENTQVVKYSDIATHWSKVAVQNLLKKNAIPFHGANFNPDYSIKKSEMAIMLHNALDIQIAYLVKPNIKDYFDDIKQDAPYADTVIDLVSANIFEGKGHFNPEGNLTKEEMIHYVMQAYKYKMGDNYAMIKIGPATFRDADQISAEFGGDVARAQHEQLVAGNGNHMFQPKKAATRAEAAVVINKLTELLEKQNQQVLVQPEVVVKTDSIEMKIMVKNNTKSDIIIENTSGQKFDFELLDKNKSIVYKWSADKSFVAALTTTKIEAGKTVEFSDTLSSDDYKALKGKISYLKAYITGKASFIKAEGYELKIN